MKLSDIHEDAYTPQQIFDQVWEDSYEWFKLPDVPENETDKLPSVVWEVDYPDGFKEQKIQAFIITEEMIEEAAFKWFDMLVAQNSQRKLSDFVQDMDVNDVDAILQLACFGEIRYG